MKATKMKIIEYKDPDFEGLIDEDILERFKDSNVFYSDIINAQLIKTIQELIKSNETKYPCWMHIIYDPECRHCRGW